MFCSRCGAQVEPVDNFCKNCGAKLKRSSASGAINENSKTEPERFVKQETIRQFSTPRERKGFGTMFITIGLSVVVIAGSALYFGIDLLRELANPEVPHIPEITSGRVEGANSLSADRTKQSAKPGDNTLASAPTPEISASTTPSPDVSKSAPKSNAAPPSRSAALESGKPANGAGGSQVSSATHARALSAGTYKTTRSTPVFESPSDSASVVANIPGGVRVNVVSAKGEWLEVHSKRGNPPGFIRRKDAMFLGKAKLSE